MYARNIKGQCQARDDVNMQAYTQQKRAADPMLLEYRATVCD